MTTQAKMAELRKLVLEWARKGDGSSIPSNPRILPNGQLVIRVH